MERNQLIDRAEDEKDTGVTVAINTAYKLRVVIDKNRVPYFYVDDKLVVVGTALTDATDFIPYPAAVKASGVAAAKVLTCRYVEAGRKYA